MGSEKLPKIAIVDDHVLFAEGLRSLLEGSGIGRCVCYASGEEAVRGIPQEKPDIALVDLHLPGLGGLEVVKVLKEKLPDLRVLILTMDASGESLFRALSFGVQGYILKSSSFAKIAGDIQAALQGDTVIGREMMGYLAEKGRSKARQGGSKAFDELTPREKEVLRLIVQGKDNREIAQELFLSEKTVKNYVTNILTKLNLEDRVKLVIFAIQEGFSLEEDTPRKEEYP